MRRQFLLASIGAITLTGSAFAADLTPPPPPPPVPIFTWTGVYLGGQVGYAWGTGNDHFSGFVPVPGVFVDSSIGGPPHGVIGGANVGYNYQINQWVLGLEGTVDGTSVTNNAAVVFPSIFGGATLSETTNASVQGSIRGRVGFAWDRLLIYGTGGVAFGGFKTDVTFAGTSAHVPFFSTGYYSNTRVGWTVGGGLQYAITNNWSVRAEYRYTDFGNIREGIFGLPAGAFFNEGRQIRQNQVQVGFDYRFDMLPPPVPVVAKY